jgi:hypothetical protein
VKSHKPTAMASGNPEPAAPAEETFKQQLDRVATERRNNQEPQVNPIVEKSKSLSGSLHGGTYHCAGKR